MDKLSIKQIKGEDFISLTEIAKNREGGMEPRFILRDWVSNNNTVLFLEEWERVNSPNFKRGDFDTFKIEVFNNQGRISVKKYIELVQPFGIISKAGRYGGTFGHIEVA